MARFRVYGSVGVFAFPHCVESDRLLLMEGTLYHPTVDQVTIQGIAAV